MKQIQALLHGRVMRNGQHCFFSKKAVSSFIPQNKMIWDPIQKEGNPTWSTKVNYVITKVKKFKLRGEGVVSKARRPIEYDEFIDLMKVLQNEERLSMGN